MENKFDKQKSEHIEQKELENDKPKFYKRTWSSKVIVLFLVLCISAILGNFTAFAYNIWMSGGFSPTPAYLYCYSGFSSETLAAVHNGCLAWNGGGQGNLVYRSTSTHSTTVFPYKNYRNEITKGARGTNTYLMATCSTQLSGAAITEADIDINISYDFGSSDTSYDTRTAMTHEIGHVLGLDEMRTGINNVMYYRRGVGEEVYSLSTDDRNGLAAIYQGRM